ncbi:MAG: ParB/RepB/Spo0J family partition protein, partial [Syntrophus sp. (in: bacteria)]
MKEKQSTKEKKPTSTKNTKAIAAAAAAETQPMNPRTFMEIGLTQIRINPLNPRKNFSGPKYDELLASIRTKGVIVPVLLRPLPEETIDPMYEIIAGERRFRASCEVAKGNGGIEKASIPAIVQMMDDDNAYDCMTIENLQRADLTPLEEARAFKLYLDRKGPESLQDLAERIGINPCYIRRRAAVLDLPEKILNAWEEGEIAHGHLEQLIRVSDPKEQKELYEDTVRQDMSVRNLKKRIESRNPKLSSALFDRSGSGCLSCPQNTDIQRSLFGEGIATKALCHNPACYKRHQGEWIPENWPKFKSSRKLDTNGVRFDDDVNWNDYQTIHSKLNEKWETCEYLLSIIYLDGKVRNKTNCFG